MMKINIGSPHRAWTFDLARQLDQRDHLNHLYTGYPKNYVEGLPIEKISAFPWIIGPLMLMGRLGLYGLQKRMKLLAIETFDIWVESVLEPCDVFHSLSAYGLKSHRAAKARYNALTVCDRPSTHIEFQEEILADEYSRWGLKYAPMSRRIVERELQEYQETDVIAVPSDFALRSFVEKGISAAKLLKVPFGVDLDIFKQIPKADEVFRVVYVGSVELRKGIPYLLEAISSIDFPDFEVWLIGAVHREIRELLGRYDGPIRYLGVIPRTKLFEYYSQCSVLVLPSVEDGFGLVMNQAMACGLPIVASENTGVRDLIIDGKEGFIVPIRSADAIREKIVYLYENSIARHQMSQAAMERVQSLGGLETYGEQMFAGYVKALEPSQQIDLENEEIGPANS